MIETEEYVINEYEIFILGKLHKAFNLKHETEVMKAFV